MQNGYHAAAQFADYGCRITLRLEVTPGGASLTDTLQLRVVHPTRAGCDGLVMRRKRADGPYSGVGPGLTEGRWMLILQDQQSMWRLDGAMVAPQNH
ncbi:MAG: FixH family protein [Burkholderiales bacterium]